MINSPHSFLLFCWRGIQLFLNSYWTTYQGRVNYVGVSMISMSPKIKVQWLSDEKSTLRIRHNHIRRIVAFTLRWDYHCSNARKRTTFILSPNNYIMSSSVLKSMQHLLLAWKFTKGLKVEYCVNIYIKVRRKSGSSLE